MLAVSDLPAEFAGLDYPGRTKPKNRTPQVQETTPDINVWDARPAFYVIGGRKQEFFLISHLAQALGYSVQSIRAWEAQRLLPKSPYRSPKTRGMVAGGRSNKGRRLWTREQIEAILSAAKRHKVILNREPPSEAFYRDVQKAFDQISEADRASTAPQAS
jgi:hypothetical protein